MCWLDFLGFVGIPDSGQCIQRQSSVIHMERGCSIHVHCMFSQRATNDEMSPSKRNEHVFQIYCQT